MSAIIKEYELGEEGLKDAKHIEKLLSEIKFQTSGNRRPLTVSGKRPTSMPIGMKKMLDGTYGVPTFDKLYPHIYPVIRDFINKYAPDFNFNCGYVNKNVHMKPHKDKANTDSSLIIALGSYTGGNLIVEDEPLDIRYRLIEFDGKRQTHWTEEFEGDRYSIVIFEI